MYIEDRLLNSMTESNEQEMPLPSPADYMALSFVEMLDDLFVAHSEILEESGESIAYYPDEISLSLDTDVVEELWATKNYTAVKGLYVELWLDDIKDVTGIEAYFTVDDFVDGTAQGFLNE